jgi:hypothetical protein
MNPTVRFVKAYGKFDISVIFGALENRIVLVINVHTFVLDRHMRLLLLCFPDKTFLFFVFFKNIEKNSPRCLQWAIPRL